MRAVRHAMSIVGTRPNFMKAAPGMGAGRDGRAIGAPRPNFMRGARVTAPPAHSDPPIRHTLVHTDQHYDEAMSCVFLDQLGVGEPDHRLDIGSGTHATQTARV